MNVAAGILGILFAAAQGAPVITLLRKPVAARGSHDQAAIPVWGRVLWVLLALTMLIGSVLYLVSANFSTALIIATGGGGMWLLAIANGFWVHGRPTLSHHLVRGVILAVILGLAFAGAN